MLAGYFEGGIGFTGTNLNVAIELEYATRGGKIPFILGIDANIPPEEWAAFPWGDQNFLDHMEAEIVVVRNSPITCTGALNEEGGSNIDYFVMSKCLMGGIEECEADFEVSFAPHYGLVLKIGLDPTTVLTRTLLKPDMPKRLKLLDNKQIEENSFQKKQKQNRAAKT